MELPNDFLIVLENRIDYISRFVVFSLEGDLVVMIHAALWCTGPTHSLCFALFSIKCNTKCVQYKDKTKLTYSQPRLFICLDYTIEKMKVCPQQAKCVDMTIDRSDRHDVSPTGTHIQGHFAVISGGSETSHYYNGAFSKPVLTIDFLKED